MATQALIKINGVVGSNDDLPINTIVDLDNQGLGGESTYLWQILDQPAGTADVLSATNIEAPTFTPKKEGTYLLKLTVNHLLSNEKSNQVVAAVRQLKTRQRIPAAGESVEDSATEGYAGSGTTPLFQLLDAVRADSNLLVGVSGAVGLTKGMALYVKSSTTIKTGLPGQETVPNFDAAIATDPTLMGLPIYVLEGGVNGSSTPSIGDLIVARHTGLFLNFTASGSLNDPVFVSDTGPLQAGTPGTLQRRVGRIVRAGGGTIDIAFEGAAPLGASSDRQYACASGLAVSQVVYSDSAGHVAAADASDPTKMPAIGVVLSKPTTTTCIVRHSGPIGGFGGTLTADKVYYVSTTAGQLVTTSDGGFPSSDGQVEQIAGVAIDTSTLDAHFSLETVTR